MTKNLKIIESGRLGNFIIQLKNAIQISLYYKYNIIIPPKKFFNTTYIVINKDITIKNDIITDENNYFRYLKIKDVDNILFNLNLDKTYKIIKDIFTIKCDNILGLNDLLIHIRSGDIFYNNIHPLYLSPPLSYYVNIINKNNYDNIYLISEDRRNPTVDALLKIYPNIKFKIQSLEEDIKLILGSTNIIMSFGSFIPSLLILSDLIKQLYIPSYILDTFKIWGFNNNSYNCVIIDLDEYKKIIGNWNNSLEQHKILLEYKIS